jgi:hypothetical protein
MAEEVCGVVAQAQTGRLVRRSGGRSRVDGGAFVTHLAGLRPAIVLKEKMSEDGVRSAGGGRAVAATGAGALHQRLAAARAPVLILGAIRARCGGVGA